MNRHRANLTPIVPHDPEAEAALVGMALAGLGEGWVDAVAELGGVDALLDERLRLVAVAIDAQVKRDGACGVPGVVEYLRGIGVLERAGGEQFVRDLSASVFRSPVAMEGYARIVGGLAQRRRLGLAGEAVANAAYEGNGKLPDSLERMRQLIEQVNADTKEEPAPFTFHTTAEFDALDLRREYHVPGILAAGPVPTVMSGSFKTLKTSIALELLLSLAAGFRFLGHYPVHKCRTALMSGESGGFALQSLARRIVHARGWTMAAVGDNFRICTSVVSLAVRAELEHIEKFIIENEIKVFAIDPVYLAMRGLRSDDAGNLFSMGAFLEPLARMGERTGCTPIVIHHNGRGATRANEGQPAELADIAWAGFPEWAGQWLLLARRERYDPDSNGYHRLWLTAGGRDGHSTLVGVNVTEGRQDDPDGRRWEVEVEAASDVRREAVNAKEQQREQDQQAKRERQAEQDREAIITAMRSVPACGETQTAIRTLSGIRAERFAPVFASLLSDGTITNSGTIKKANKMIYDAYRLASTHRFPSVPIGSHNGLD